MKLTTQWKRVRYVLLFVFIVLVLTILFLPFSLKFLTIPEQLFILSFIVFFIIYAKVIGGYYFVNNLLNLINNEEDLYQLLKENLSKHSLAKYLLEGDLLLLAESQILKLKEISSLLLDATLLFLLILFGLNISLMLPDPIFFALTIPAVVVIVFVWLIELYIDAKFIKTFEKEIDEFYKVAKALDLENKLEENVEEITESTNNKNVENQKNKKLEENK